MMATLLLAILLMLVVVAAMAIGIMFGRAPIKGSCGGMSAMTGGGTCEICGGNPAKCEEASSKPLPESERTGGEVRTFDPRGKQGDKPS